MTRPLTPGMRQALENLAAGKAATAGLSGRSAAGGFATTWAALLARGYVTAARGMLTRAGAEAIGRPEAVPVVPNLAFGTFAAHPLTRAQKRELEARGAAEVGAALPDVRERLAALLPVTLMDAACELDVPFKVLRGHALGLMRAGRARMYRGRLVAIPSDKR